ncbi:myosin light chain kinase, smooth muscle [Nephila pilipes]|uniref:Myosin light chain kinase, smooth muscle n=1 Tax=Nephila pilipes TaxID=299642 RepID=A0A8X6QZ27_NEPPI|nr:myosin light chain kinase, smooth muscle [Nephila pilipes]
MIDNLELEVNKESRSLCNKRLRINLFGSSDINLTPPVKEFCGFQRKSPSISLLEMTKLEKFGFIILVSASFSQAVDYHELSRWTSGTCPPRDNCRLIGDKSFAERNCECDQFCSAFQDCCIDAPESPLWRIYRSRSTTCMPYGKESSVGAYVVGNCPANYAGPKKVKDFCEGHDDFEDPFFSTPVTDVLANVTFRNRYCVECNRAVTPSLKSWFISIKFENLPTHYPSESAFDIVWLHNNKEIKPSEDFQYAHDGDVYKLIIPEIFPEDTGTYTCDAFNDSGEIFSTCTLDVQVPSEKSKGPEFASYPVSLAIHEGQPAVFTAVLKKEAKKVEWTKDGRVIDEKNTRMKMSSDGPKYTLTIPSAAATDMANSPNTTRSVKGLYVTIIYRQKKRKEYRKMFNRN